MWSRLQRNITAVLKQCELATMHQVCLPTPSTSILQKGLFQRESFAVSLTMRGVCDTTVTASVKLLPWLGHSITQLPGGGTVP
eukprot:6707-Heterococcus_DN1.PRE.2